MRPNPIRRLLLFAAAAAAGMLVAAAPAFAGITVIPDQYDFGEVEVGSTASTQIEISNAWWGNLTIDSVDILQAGSDFTLVNPPPSGTVVLPGSSLFMGVEFSPAAEGLATATAEVQWTNGEEGTSYVELSGTGVAATPLTIEDVLAFFDAGVEAETIRGTGPTEQAKTSHERVFRLMLLLAASAIDDGKTGLACQMLEHSYLRSDGQGGPKDYVQGQDCIVLNSMILQLRADMGCL